MPRAGLTADRLAEVAADRADEVGVDALSLSALARHFGVAVPSLYAHVRSLRDLQVRVALLALEESADLVAAALAGVSGRDALAAVGGVWRTYAREHPGRYAATRLPLDAATAAASAGPRHADLARASLRDYALPDADRDPRRTPPRRDLARLRRPRRAGHPAPLLGDPMTDPTLVETLVKGALELQRTDRGLLPHRLPAWTRAQPDDRQLHLVEAQPAGVRLALRTAATRLELEVLPTKRRYVGAPARPDGWYDVLVDGVLVDRLQAPGGNVLDVDMMTGASTMTAVDDDRPRWVHHGSSISHGSIATHPTEPRPVVAARLAGLDLVNLGLGGSALLGPFVARTIRDTRRPDQPQARHQPGRQDLVRRRALAPAVHGWLDTIRDGHPDTPARLVSPLHCAIHESVPGPTAPDAEGRAAFVAGGDPAQVARGALTLEVVREVLAEVVERRGDPRLAYVDGLALYGPADEERLPLTDNLHPDSAAHRLIVERFAALAWPTHTSGHRP